MKLRTFFFDKAVFRKNATRFAPLWALYFLLGLLVMMTVLDNAGINSAAEFLGGSIAWFAPINLIYAIFAAQLLFGDLFNSRLCNALHALPLRRETWFCTHTLSGIAFSLVPHAAASLFFMLFLRQFWFLAALWVLGMLLQYLFFFGLATLCMLCTGNRFAATAVYAIVNFLSLIVWWFVNTVYIPLLYGIRLVEKSFALFCPTVQLCAYYEDMFLFYRPDHAVSNSMYFSGLGKGWIYLAVLAALGIGLLALALLVYRKRKLESAGDFVAVRGLGPAFSVVYTLCVAAVFAMFGDLMMDTYVVFFIFGLAVGFFTGQMLLERTVKVFREKNFARLGILGGALILTLVLTVIDPLGITRWVPEENRVAEVYYNQGDTWREDKAGLTDPEIIRQVTALHEEILAQGPVDKYAGNTFTLSLFYKLTDGRTVQREYRVYLSQSIQEKLTKLFSAPKYVLGYDDWEEFVGRIEAIHLDKYGDIRPAQIRELLEAVKADCEAGNMAQIWQFHDHSMATTGLQLSAQQSADGQQRWFYLEIFSEAEYTNAWIKANVDRYGDVQDPYGKY